MKELLQAGVPIPIAMKASKQVGNYSDDAQHIIDRQHSALILMSMILDDVRRGYPKLSAELDRIIQQAIDNAGTGPELAERLEQETWMGVDMATGKAARAQQSGEGREAVATIGSDSSLAIVDMRFDLDPGTKLYTYPPADKPEGKCKACGGSGFRSAGDGKIGTWPCEFCERPAAPDMGGEK